MYRLLYSGRPVRLACHGSGSISVVGSDHANTLQPFRNRYSAHSDFRPDLRLAPTRRPAGGPADRRTGQPRGDGPGSHRRRRGPGGPPGRRHQRQARPTPRPALAPARPGCQAACRASRSRREYPHPPRAPARPAHPQARATIDAADRILGTALRSVLFNGPEYFASIWMRFSIKAMRSSGAGWVERYVGTLGPAVMLYREIFFMKESSPLGSYPALVT